MEENVLALVNSKIDKERKRITYRLICSRLSVALGDPGSHGKIPRIDRGIRKACSLINQ